MLKLFKLVLFLIDDVVREERPLELLLEFLPSVDGATPLPYFRLFTPPSKHGHLRKIQHSSVDLTLIALQLIALEVILQMPQKILHLLRVTNAFEHRWLGSLDRGLSISVKRQSSNFRAFLE